MCYTNIGISNSNLSNYRQALYYHQQALQIATEIGGRKRVSDCYTNIGISHFNLSNYQKAISYYEQALSIKKEIGDKQGESACHGNLGNIYSIVSDYPKAISYYEQGLSIAKEIGDRLGEIVCYIGLGNSCNLIPNYPKSISYYEQGLSIAKEIGDKQGESTCYFLLSSIQFHLSHYDQAISYCEYSLKIAKEIGDQRRESICYFLLSSIQFLLSHYDQAISYCEYSLKIAKEIGDKGGEIEAYKHLGYFYLAVKKPEEAYEYLKKSIDLSELVGSNLIEDEYKVRYYGLSVNAYEVIVNLCINLGKEEEAFRYVERSKLKAFIDLMATKEIEPSVKDYNNKDIGNLIFKERELIRKKRSLQMRNLSTSNHTTGTNMAIMERETQQIYKPDEIQDILVELNQIQDEIEKYDAEYVSLRRPKPVSLDELRKHLSLSKENPVLIEYFVTEDKINVFIVTPNDFHIERVNVSRETIDNLVKEYQTEVLNFPDLIKKRKEITNEWLFSLSRYLINPLSDHLKDKQIIYFVPHYKLHYLPLHALLLNDEPLTRNYEVVYTSGASLLQFYKEIEDINNRSIRTCNSFGVALEQDEKEFLEEAQRIAEIFHTKPKLDITKQEVLQNLNSDILHFSCHGYFDAEDPFASGIVLKDEQTLTAREIFSYQIKAGLVTLSACETGISENRPGDELIGLTRSLLYAGAQSVVVSLWSASAVAAELTMVEFYSNLIKGDDKARALRKAQLKIRKELKGK